MTTTLEEERKEVWSAILDGMSEDPDRAEACRYLLRHLLQKKTEFRSQFDFLRYRFTGTTSSKIFAGS